eukprot:gene3271-4098_t
MNTNHDYDELQQQQQISNNISNLIDNIDINNNNNNLQHSQQQQQQQQQQLDRDSIISLNDSSSTLFTTTGEEEPRIILNVGGKRFETFRSTLLHSKFPTSLLSTMFNDRNRHLLKPNHNGEYFFDRSSKIFEYILNSYRTGEIDVPPPSSIPWKMFCRELDYFQLPIPQEYDPNSYDDGVGGGLKYSSSSSSSLMNNNYYPAPPCTLSSKSFGCKLVSQSLTKAREEVGEMLESIKTHIYTLLRKAGEQGKQSEIIQFKSFDNEDFYSFISNLRNRELLLHDLMNENLEVTFSEDFGHYYHSYLFQITFWNRYTRHNNTGMPPPDQVLNEFRQKFIQLADILYKK